MMISATDSDISAKQTLSTKLEEDFISPLTAVRGTLETLRDFPQLSDDERQQFIHNALTECSRLEPGIEQLAKTVFTYAENGNSQSTHSKMLKSLPLPRNPGL